MRLNRGEGNVQLTRRGGPTLSEVELKRDSDAIRRDSNKTRLLGPRPTSLSWGGVALRVTKWGMSKRRGKVAGDGKW